MSYCFIVEILGNKEREENKDCKISWDLGQESSSNSIKLLDNCFLVSDGVLLLVFLWTFGGWHFYEIVTEGGECTFKNIQSEYSESNGKIMEKPTALHHP